MEKTTGRVLSFGSLYTYNFTAHKFTINDFTLPYANYLVYFKVQTAKVSKDFYSTSTHLFDITIYDDTPVVVFKPVAVVPPSKTYKVKLEERKIEATTKTATKTTSKVADVSKEDKIEIQGASYASYEVIGESLEVSIDDSKIADEGLKTFKVIVSRASGATDTYEIEFNVVIPVVEEKVEEKKASNSTNSTTNSTAEEEYVEEALSEEEVQEELQKAIEEGNLDESELKELEKNLR